MLTDTKIRAAKPTEKPYKLADGEGLYLLINPDGGRWAAQGHQQQAPGNDARYHPDAAGPFALSGVFEPAHDDAYKDHVVDSQHDLQDHKDDKTDDTFGCKKMLHAY